VDNVLVEDSPPAPHFIIVITNRFKPSRGGHLKALEKVHRIKLSVAIRHDA
jgi:hypothetical protein